MASNRSNIHDTKRIVSSNYETTEIPIMSVDHHAAAYKFSTNQRSQVVCHTSSPSSYASQHKLSNYGNHRSNVAGNVRKPAAALTSHTPNTNRVISFHSSACWRNYFTASKHSDKLIVIYFTASWCAPCKYMAPILNDFAAHYTDVEFDKIDVDELLDVSNDFKVQAMPTFLLVKKGKTIDSVTGARREELQRKIEKYRA